MEYEFECRINHYDINQCSFVCSVDVFLVLKFLYFQPKE